MHTACQRCGDSTCTFSVTEISFWLFACTQLANGAKRRNVDTFCNRGILLAVLLNEVCNNYCVHACLKREILVLYSDRAGLNL